MRILLDTNAYTAFARSDEAVAGIVRQAEQVVLSTVVIGELLYGFRAGSRYRENRDVLTAFAGMPWVTVLTVSRTTADRYARVAADLRRKGRPIATNDLWIAAHALEAGADLVSYDRHFEAIVLQTGV